MWQLSGIETDQERFTLILEGNNNRLALTFTRPDMPFCPVRLTTFCVEIRGRAPQEVIATVLETVAANAPPDWWDQFPSTEKATQAPPEKKQQYSREFILGWFTLSFLLPLAPWLAEMLRSLLRAMGEPLRRAVLQEWLWRLAVVYGIAVAVRLVFVPVTALEVDEFRVLFPGGMPMIEGILSIVDDGEVASNPPLAYLFLHVLTGETVSLLELRVLAVLIASFGPVAFFILGYRMGLKGFWVRRLPGYFALFALPIVAYAPLLRSYSVMLVTVPAFLAVWWRAYSENRWSAELAAWSHLALWTHYLVWPMVGVGWLALALRKGLSVRYREWLCLGLVVLGSSFLLFQRARFASQWDGGHSGGSLWRLLLMLYDTTLRSGLWWMLLVVLGFGAWRWARREWESPTERAFLILVVASAGAILLHGAFNAALYRHRYFLPVALCMPPLIALALPGIRRNALAKTLIAATLLNLVMARTSHRGLDLTENHAQRAYRELLNQEETQRILYFESPMAPLLLCGERFPVAALSPAGKPVEVNGRTYWPVAGKPKSEALRLMNDDGLLVSYQGAGVLPSEWASEVELVLRGGLLSVWRPKGHGAPHESAPGNPNRGPGTRR